MKRTRGGAFDQPGLPYTDHCRVLEGMFPEWTAAELFAPCRPGILADNSRKVPNRVSGEPADSQSTAEAVSTERFADVTAVFATRAEFSSAHPTDALFDGAKLIRAAGLSLNLICQQYADQRLHRLIENGTMLQALFLDPEGKAIKAREQEERYTDSYRSMLTRLNIEMLIRLRDRLSEDARERLMIGIYDETIRFNITLIDNRMCVMQPYLPYARGVDAPTFVMEPAATGTGLHGTFEEIFTSLWERSRAV